MGFSGTPNRLRGGRVRVAVIAALAAACVAPGAPAQRPAPKVDAPLQGAPGAVIQFEESQSSNILYLQEKGGMVSLVSAPASPAHPGGKAAEPAPARRMPLPTAGLPEVPKR
jgi:hypothetical protein